MGWWGHYYGDKAPKGKERMEAILLEANLMTETEHGKLIDAVLVGTTVYGAYYVKRTDRTIGIVLLSSFNDGYLMVKSMDETVGPHQSKCPRRILNLLTPLTPESDHNGWAQGWRDRCEQNLKHHRSELGSIPLFTKIQLRNPQKTVLVVELNHKGRRCYRGSGYRASAQCIKSWGYDVLETENPQG